MQNYRNPYWVESLMVGEGYYQNQDDFWLDAINSLLQHRPGLVKGSGNSTSLEFSLPILISSIYQLLMVSMMP